LAQLCQQYSLRPNKIDHKDSFANLSLAYFHLSTLYKQFLNKLNNLYGLLYEKVIEPKSFFIGVFSAIVNAPIKTYSQI